MLNKDKSYWSGYNLFPQSIEYYASIKKITTNNS